MLFMLYDCNSYRLNDFLFHSIHMLTYLFIINIIIIIIMLLVIMIRSSMIINHLV